MSAVARAVAISALRKLRFGAGATGRTVLSLRSMIILLRPDAGRCEPVALDGENIVPGSNRRLARELKCCNTANCFQSAAPRHCAAEIVRRSDMTEAPPSNAVRVLYLSHGTPALYDLIRQ